MRVGSMLLDLAKAYGSVHHSLIHFSLLCYHDLHKFQKLILSIQILQGKFSQRRGKHKIFPWTLESSKAIFYQFSSSTQSLTLGD